MGIHVKAHRRGQAIISAHTRKNVVGKPQYSYERQAVVAQASSSNIRQDIVIKMRKASDRARKIRQERDRVLKLRF